MVRVAHKKSQAWAAKAWRKSVKRRAPPVRVSEATLIAKASISTMLSAIKRCEIPPREAEEMVEGAI